MLLGIVELNDNVTKTPKFNSINSFLLESPSNRQQTDAAGWVGSCPFCGAECSELLWQQHTIPSPHVMIKFINNGYL